MSKIIQTLITAAASAPEANRHRGRVYGMQRGICSNNGIDIPGDPDNQRRRRIKATLPSKGVSETGWLDCFNQFPGEDPPLPKIGDTVFVMFVDGNPHDGVWLGVSTNMRNPAFKQDNPVADSSQVIPGNKSESVNGNDTQVVKGDSDVRIEGDSDREIEGEESVRIDGGYRLSVGNRSGASNPPTSSFGSFESDASGLMGGEIDPEYALIVEGEAQTVVTGNIKQTAQNINIQASRTAKITNGAGCSIAIEPSGLITIEDALGRKIVIGGAGSDIMTCNLQGGAIRIVNASGFSINGKEVATVEARDDDGDVLIDRGW